MLRTFPRSDFEFGNVHRHCARTHFQNFQRASLKAKTRKFNARDLANNRYHKFTGLRSSTFATLQSFTLLAS